MTPVKVIGTKAWTASPSLPDRSLFLTLLLVAATSVAQDPSPCETLPDRTVLAEEETSGLHLVTNLLRSTDRFRAVFRQTKDIEVLTKPLVSSGELLFDHELGLVWHTTEPVDATFMMTDTKVSQRYGDREWQVLSSGSAPPALQSLGDLFVALFSGRVDVLQDHFEIHSFGNKTTWTLGLTPTDPQLRRVIECVVLTGSQHVETVDISEIGGDRSRLQFSDVDQDVEKWTTEERATFDI